MLSTQIRLHTPTSRIYLTSTSVKEVLHSFGIRGQASPNMIRRMTTLGLALTSSIRSPRMKNTTCHLFTRERCHYQWMGLSYDPTFKVHDFFRAHTPGK
jgi:hypothetical protein